MRNTQHVCERTIQGQFASSHVHGWSETNPGGKCGSLIAPKSIREKQSKRPELSPCLGLKVFVLKCNIQTVKTHNSTFLAIARDVNTCRLLVLGRDGDVLALRQENEDLRVSLKVSRPAHVKVRDAASQDATSTRLPLFSSSCAFQMFVVV